MFYRFLSKLATQERLEAFPVYVPHRRLNPFGPPPKDYEDRFERIDEDLPYLGLAQLHAPAYGSKKYGLRLRFHPGKDQDAVLPDIWGVGERLIVSKRVKQVITKIDPFGHEFIKIGWIDADEQPVETEQPYYWFHPRRFLRIEPGSRIATADELGFYPIPGEEDFLARVLDDAVLRERVEQIPLWRHYATEGITGRQSAIRMVLYMNEQVADALQGLEARGFALYSLPFGVGEESAVELPEPPSTTAQRRGRVTLGNQSSSDDGTVGSEAAGRRPLVYRMLPSLYTVGRWSPQAITQGLPADRVKLVHPFDYDNVVEVQPQTRPCSGCHVFRAPVLGEWYASAVWEIDGAERNSPAGKNFPEIFVHNGVKISLTLVSERVKAIIEAIDDFGHQFWPARFVSPRGKPIASPQPYYTLHVRRLITIEPCDKPHDKVDFEPYRKESPLISAIQHRPGLRECLDTLPLWRHRDVKRNISRQLYLNHDFVTRLNQAGVRGAEEYSISWGKKMESIGHV